MISSSQRTRRRSISSFWRFLSDYRRRNTDLVHQPSQEGIEVETGTERESRRIETLEIGNSDRIDQVDSAAAVEVELVDRSGGKVDSSAASVERLSKSDRLLVWILPLL